MAPTCDLCILVFCIVTAKCTVVCIELVFMDINTVLYMSIVDAHPCVQCRAINYSVQCLHLHCVVLQPSVGTVHVYHSARLHCTSALQYKVALCGHCRGSEVAKHSSFADQSESVIDHYDDHDWCPSGI